MLCAITQDGGILEQRCSGAGALAGTPGSTYPAHAAAKGAHPVQMLLRVTKPLVAELLPSQLPLWCNFNPAAGSSSTLQLPAGAMRSHQRAPQALRMT